MKNVTDETFDAIVINSDKPVLVDFWAEWCGPCKSLAPTLEKLSEEFGDKIEVVKVNIDECIETGTKFTIQSVPTLMLFQNGEKISSKVGNQPKAVLKTWIESEFKLTV